MNYDRKQAQQRAGIANMVTDPRGATLVRSARPVPTYRLVIGPDGGLYRVTVH